MRKFSILFTIFIVITLMSCSSYNIHRLDNTKLKPKPSNVDINIYAGKLDGPKKRIAVIESASYPDKSDQSKIRQIGQLKKAARKLGADAVEDVKLLRKKVRGFVLDERVPFPAWKQGEYELYFLRGDAIVFANNNTTNE